MESFSALLAIVVLVLDILAIAHVWQRSIEVGRKLIWSLVILLVPVVGLVMWAVAAGPFGKARL
ncbi:hypothetical protein GFL09_08085 [Pseudomonas stutzeri]|uniref:PLDc N-terminal domain-containing protein n=1 Tax=Stutzerimonas stutzeri TaxID=316 RepID=UPI00190B12A4|nr:PLDc N-terminal domain-containing protein [Stutzerimonas stutzeri]MBK3867649.1 hypothetical protein [Stutzerimonas stutzeri]